MEIEMTRQTSNKPIRFTNDIFFKYCLAGNDEDSKALRQGIIFEVLHREFKELDVLNPEINATVLQGKGVRLDILLQDTISKEIINIEMQVSKYKSKEAKRFQFYGSRLVVNQIDSGEEYKKLAKVYQIIFIDDVIEGGNLINYYQSKNQDSEVEEENLITRIYIHLPEINRIVKEKGIGQLTNFEKVCYLFKNNRNSDILKEIDREEGMVKILMEKYNEFPKESKLWSWAQAIEDGEMYVRSRISEGYEEGKEQGIRDGMKKGIKEGIKEGIAQGKFEEKKLDMVIAIKNRYQMDVKEWIETLTWRQLNSVLEYIFKIEDFNEFKEKVERIK